jgi:hypothetical protein
VSRQGRRVRHVLVAWALTAVASTLVGCAEPRRESDPRTLADAGDTMAGKLEVGASTGDAPTVAPGDSGAPAGGPDAPVSPGSPDGPLRTDAAASVLDAAPGKAPPGERCRIDHDCQTDICRREVCCAGPCALCQSCRGPAGSCLNVPAGEDDYQGTTRCYNGYACDGAGSCRSTTAQACTRPADCPSGFCSDGVCCDRACSGVCETCAGAFPGVCTAISNRNDDPGCAGDDAVCLGAGRCGAIDQRQLNVGATAPLFTTSLGQIIVPARNGRMAGVRLRGNCSGEARLAVAITEVVAGRPGEQVLASSSLPYEQLTPPPGGGALGISLFPFDPPVPTTIGRPLAMVLSNSGGTCSVTMDGHVIPGDPYPPGGAFRRLPGEGWVQESGDVWFETVLAP